MSVNNQLKRGWRLLLFCFILLQYKSAKSQIDTVFWFAAPEVSSSLGDNPIYLKFLTYNTPATITISQPANMSFTPIVLNLPANSNGQTNLTPFLSQIESPAANVVSNNGLKVSSTAPISAFFDLQATNNKEIFSLKGQKALGTNFYTPFQTFFAAGSTTPASFHSFEIVATQPNTTVLITPRANIVGHSANVTYSISLNAGQTYSGRTTSTAATPSLAGSIISADKPVAVTVHSGALSSAGCMNTTGDQITTTEHIGTDYIIYKNNAFNERIYVLATQNATTVEIYKSTNSNTLINWGETHQVTTNINDTVIYIKTNKPVYVYHLSGNGCRLAAAQVPPVFCAGTYETSFSRHSSDSIGVFLYTRTGFESMFALNGNASLVPASAFKNVPGTSGQFKSALIYYNTTDVPVGSYNKITNSGDIFGLGIIHGQHSAGSGYAYLSQFSSSPFVEAGPAVDTTCANVPYTVNGIVGGGSVTGFWGSSGFGSFQNPLNSLNNTYVPSNLDTLVSPIRLVLTSSPPCPTQRDTIFLHVLPAPIVNASVDQSVCNNNPVVNLNGSVIAGSTTGIWTSLGTGGTFSPNNTTLNATFTPSSTDISNGSVTLVLTSTNAGVCLNVSDTMVVTFTQAATVNAGPATVSVCANNPQVSLSGTVSAPFGGKWTTSGTGFFLPNNLSLNCTYQPTTADVNSGSVTLYLESTNNGNCLPVYDSIVVTFTPAPTVNAGTNIIACTNSPTVQLNGTVSGPTTTGIWSGGSGTFTPSNTTLNAVYTPTPAEVLSGTIFLTLTSTNNQNCNAVNSTVQINFVAPPFANFNFNNVCQNETTVFTDFSLPGFGSLNAWQWDFGDNTNSALQNPTHLYAAPGNYTVQLIATSNSGCSDTITQTVSVYPKPVADFTYTGSCNGAFITINFTDSSYVNNGTINYWYYDFGGPGNIVAQNPTQVFTTSGNYTVTHAVATTQGCRDTIVKIVNVPPRPDADFTYNFNAGPNVGSIYNFVNLSSNSTSYYWTFGDGNNSTDVNPLNTYFNNGNYYVTLYAYGAFGCVDSTTKIIVINNVTTEISTLIPNAISPNGDGKNDVWKLGFINLLYPDAEVYIYNRWGQEMFSSKGYNTPWDGTYNNEPVPDATYYYVIKLNDSQSQIFKGSILVLRNKD
jgi:gliding motility-associated-like protein